MVAEVKNMVESNVPQDVIESYINRASKINDYIIMMLYIDSELYIYAKNVVSSQRRKTLNFNNNTDSYITFKDEPSRTR